MALLFENFAQVWWTIDFCPGDCVFGLFLNHNTMSIHLGKLVELGNPIIAFLTMRARSRGWQECRCSMQLRSSHNRITCKLLSSTWTLFWTLVLEMRRRVAEKSWLRVNRNQLGRWSLTLMIWYMLILLLRVLLESNLKIIDANEIGIPDAVVLFLLSGDHWRHMLAIFCCVIEHVWLPGLLRFLTWSQQISKASLITGFQDVLYGLSRLILRLRHGERGHVLVSRCQLLFGLDRCHDFVLELALLLKVIRLSSVTADLHIDDLVCLLELVHEINLRVTFRSWVAQDLASNFQNLRHLPSRLNSHHCLFLWKLGAKQVALVDCVVVLRSSLHD